jgi:hypothetical protein
VGEQHRLAGVGEGGDGGAQLAGADRVDTDGGLVQEQHRRIVQQPLAICRRWRMPRE